MGLTQYQVPSFITIFNFILCFKNIHFFQCFSFFIEKSEFANWRNYDRFIVKRPVQPTVIYDLPFFAKTTYYDSFSNEKGGRKHEKIQSMKPQGNE